METHAGRVPSGVRDRHGKWIASDQLTRSRVPLKELPQRRIFRSPGKADRVESGLDDLKSRCGDGVRW
jgi:hypothetical protein